MRELEHFFSIWSSDGNWQLTGPNVIIDIISYLHINAQGMFTLIRSDSSELL